MCYVCEKIILDHGNDRTLNSNSGERHVWDTKPSKESK
jgi:hypothetical protein